MEDLQLSIDSHGGNPLDRQPYYNDYVDSSADCPADKMSEGQKILWYSDCCRRRGYCNLRMDQRKYVRFCPYFDTGAVQHLSGTSALLAGRRGDHRRPSLGAWIPRILFRPYSAAAWSLCVAVCT